MNGGASPGDGESFSLELTPPDQVFSLEMSDSDRREAPRHVLQVLARIRPPGDEPLDALTADLSAHGLALTTTRALNVGRECDVELGINAPELARSPALRATVRYCARLPHGEFRIGMKFTAVSIEAAEMIVAALGL